MSDGTITTNVGEEICNLFSKYFSTLYKETNNTVQLSPEYISKHLLPITGKSDNFICAEITIEAILKKLRV